MGCNPAVPSSSEPEDFPTPLRAASRTEVWLGRRRLTYFGGCDYFRLASHPQVITATIRAARELGLGVAASRRTTGNHPLYGQLEARLAEHFRAGSALVVSSGYVTNLIVVQALAGEFTHLLIDSGAHSSLQDATAFFAGKVLTHRSGDVADAVRQQRKLPTSARCLVLAEGIHSATGAAAPLAELRARLRPETWLLVDDCHGFGTVGKTGRGSLELAGIDRERVIQTGTLSKAFGTFGGAILADQHTIRKISGSRLFIGSTPPPLPLVAASLTSLRVVQARPVLLRRLQTNVARVKSALHAAGRLDTMTPGPALRLVPRDEEDRDKLQRSLLQAGIFPSFLRYPGFPASGAFRFGISSEHSRAQLDALIAALAG